MGTVLVDAGASVVYCEGNPPPANGYSWWWRYNGAESHYAVSDTDGDALITSAAGGWSTFDSDAATRLGAAYSGRPADVRRAVWKAFTRVMA